MIESIINFVLVTILGGAIFFGFFLVISLIFKGKEGLFEWLEWIKDIPMGCLFIVGWGLYWTVGMCLALLFIDLVLVHKITGGLGFWMQILLLIVVVYLLWSFYVLYCKITKRNS